MVRSVPSWNEFGKTLLPWLCWVSFRIQIHLKKRAELPWVIPPRSHQSWFGFFIYGSVWIKKIDQESCSLIYQVKFSNHKIFRRTFKNSLAPVLTISGFMIGAYIVFAVIVEYVFGLGGIGSLLVGATLTQDYPTVMASLSFIGLGVQPPRHHGAPCWQSGRIIYLIAPGCVSFRV